VIARPFFLRHSLCTVVDVLAALLLVPLLAPATVHGAATIVIVNQDGANEGLNDPTPAAPVGGNPGTTLGQQRLFAYQRAAEIWGAVLNSPVPVTVGASFDPLTCTTTSAVFSRGGPVGWTRDFPGAPLAGTWYPTPLLNALRGVDSDLTTVDMAVGINGNLGQPGCFTGIPFYLGLDGNHGSAVDLVAVLLHEFAHGLGFTTTTNATGALLAGFPTVFDRFLFDNTVGLAWPSMTDAQRAASAISRRKLVWTGANVSSAVPIVLQLGTPELTATAPVSLADTYLVGTATFGPALNPSGLSGEVMPVVDQLDGTGLACTPLSAINTLAVSGKVALVDRGTCAFALKAKNVQNAGAIGAIIVDNIAVPVPPGLGGADPTVTIPSVSITNADGNAFKSALRFRSRTRSGVLVTIRLNLATYAGADAAGRMVMATPNPPTFGFPPFSSGVSIVHWDWSATPNLLMEPDISGNVTHSVNVPQDLTLAALRDLGWNP
jgi:hypothetical protein